MMQAWKYREINRSNVNILGIFEPKLASNGILTHSGWEKYEISKTRPGLKANNRKSLSQRKTRNPRSEIKEYLIGPN